LPIGLQYAIFQVREVILLDSMMTIVDAGLEQTHGWNGTWTEDSIIYLTIKHLYLDT